MSLEPPLRRRRAPVAERTSDVTRMRGLAIAAGVAAAAAVGAAFALSSRDAMRGTPGPLARPHELAGVTCAACHDARSMTDACTGCHGPHPSTRAAHRELAPACATCHAGHNAGGGVTLANGAARRYGAGTEVPAGATAHRAEGTVSVPVVTASACAGCHDLASPRDPASGCLVPGQEALGGARPTVCFDEHRPVRDASGAISARAAAWDAARDVAAAVPTPPSPPPAPRGPWWWIAGALALGALLWIITARLARLARRSSRRAMVDTTAAPPPSAGAAAMRLPMIDAATCLGCYACVDACPYDVLEIAKYVAFVARPADCCGLILCEQKCPNGSLAIAHVDRPDRPAIEVAATLESRSVPGLYVAGDVGGQPLIRTALDQGARAARAIAERVRGDRAPGAPTERVRDDHRNALDLVIVGAGPAGLAATLEAQALGLRYLTLEQATFADSIRSFPRGKLVIDPDLPNGSRLWLAEATKEELLARWTQAIRAARPAIEEGRRVTRIAHTAAGFVVDDVDRAGDARSHTSTHVLLAIGRRGTPRRLDADVPPAWAPHVHYSLADARSFANRRVVVVGLGDVAMEAAIALSRQPGTEVTIVARGDDFQRGKARNIAEVRRRVASGNLRIIWRARVRAFDTGRVALTEGHTVACESVFVMIGSLPSEELLRATGLLDDGHRKRHVNHRGRETQDAGGASDSSELEVRP